MAKFTDNDIFLLDERFALEGLPFHSRPFHAAKAILGNNFPVGFKEASQVLEIERAYARLVPEVEFIWPGMGTGLAAAMDRVKKVTIGVVYGTAAISVEKGLGFANREEWIAWCRNDPKIAALSAFAFADMYDFVYGINAESSNENASTFWGLAAEQLKLVAESLSQSGPIGSAILQPICLTAELAMKGTLLHLGVLEADLRKPKLFGDDLIKLGNRIVYEKKHRDDPLLLSSLSTFPDYVNDRYRETHLTRIEIVKLALMAQFVAASSVRRISGEHLAIQMETSWPGSRKNFF